MHRRHGFYRCAHRAFPHTVRRRRGRTTKYGRCPRRAPQCFAATAPSQGHISRQCPRFPTRTNHDTVPTPTAALAPRAFLAPPPCPPRINHDTGEICPFSVNPTAIAWGRGRFWADFSRFGTVWHQVSPLLTPFGTRCHGLAPSVTRTKHDIPRTKPNSPRIYCYTPRNSHHTPRIFTDAPRKTRHYPRKNAHLPRIKHDDCIRHFAQLHSDYFSDSSDFSFVLYGIFSSSFCTTSSKMRRSRRPLRTVHYPLDKFEKYGMIIHDTG